MKRNCKKKIKETLLKNQDIFAWTQEELPAVERSLVEHSLNINPTTKPVRQKLRPLGEERREVAWEEMVKLKRARFIREVQYPKWLVNRVMVKKSMGG